MKKIQKRFKKMGPGPHGPVRDAKCQFSVFVSMLLVDLLSLIKSLCCLFVAIKSIWFLIGLRLGFPSGPIRDLTFYLIIFLDNHNNIKNQAR